MENITKTLRNLHKKWDVTQDELGEYFGLNKGQMANILQMKVKPPLKVVMALSDLLGISQKELLDRQLSFSELPDKNGNIQERDADHSKHGYNLGTTSNKKVHHGKVLGMLLLEKEISKGDFCSMMGYSPKNYITNFYKEELPEKVLERIGEVLKIDVTIFQGKAYSDSAGLNKTNSNDLYERFIQEKDKRIELLEQQILELREQLRRTKQ